MTALTPSVVQAFKQLPEVSMREALTMLGNVDPYIWTMTHRRLKFQGPLFYDIMPQLDAMMARKEPLNTATLLKHRPFLVQPLLDTHRHKVYKKARQVGVSELGLNEILWFLSTHPNTKFILTFPRDTQLKDFSVTRIQPALEESRLMREIVGVPNQTYLKQIGDKSYLILRSAWEGGLGEGVDADGVTFDEKDRMRDGVENSFKQCLQSSPYKLIREVSTPSLPGRGVDVAWQKSCQYKWLVRCTKCTMWQEVSYPENFHQVKDLELSAKFIPPGTYRYACRKERCRGPLDRLRGQWVAKYPEKIAHIAGYHIPQTIVPWKGPDEIMQDKIDMKLPQLWNNYTLGECSVGDKTFCTDEDFDECDAGHALTVVRGRQWSRVAVGIDWGHLNWVLVMAENAANGLCYVIGFDVIEDSPDDFTKAARGVDAFITPFDPEIIVADAGYGRDRCAYLNKKWGERFFACYYNPSDKHSRSYAPSFVEQSSRVLADRTVAIKQSVQMIKDRKIGFPGPCEFMSYLRKHFKALTPLTVQEDGEIYETIAKNGDDHLAHTFTYARMGMEHLQGSCNNFSASWT